MNRADLKKISLLRLKESEILFNERKYSGSYYLAGYSVECALKACIAKKTRKSEFPDKSAVNASYTHNLENLVKSAGIEIQLTNELTSNTAFRLNWTIVKDWSEESRYQLYSRQEAEDLFEAIAHSTEGVLRWIKIYW